MSKDEDSDYAEWVRLANDPSQSEEARQRYRAQMEDYVHRKLREAFQAVADTAPNIE
jgi:hypothetical protein